MVSMANFAGSVRCDWCGIAFGPFRRLCLLIDGMVSADATICQACTSKALDAVRRP